MIHTVRNILTKSPVVLTSKLTSKAQPVTEGDVPVTDLPPAGLPAPSLIRTAKIATIDAADATKLGKVSAASLRKVLAAIGRELGFQD